MISDARFLPAAFALLLALLVSVGAAPPAAAQISADRPGFGDGTATVAPGRVQASLGYAFDSEGDDLHEFGQLLVRTGLTDRIELRGGLGSYEVTQDQNGYSGTDLGIKGRLVQAGASTLSAVATTTLPFGTGRNDTPDDRVRQELKLAYDRALGGVATLSINAGASFFYAGGTQNDRAVEGLFIPTLSAGLTETTSVYAGYAGFYDADTDRHWIEGGLTVLANEDTQFDVNGGLRVDAATPFFVGFGLAREF